MSSTCVYTPVCDVIAPLGGVELAIDATHAYVASATALQRVPLAGGTIETLATACASVDCYRNHVHLDATDVYFTAQDGSIRKAPKIGGASSAVTTLPFFLAGIDATYVYGLDPVGPNPRIVKLPKDGSAPIPLYTCNASAGVSETGVALGTNGVVWMESYASSHQVNLVPFAGSSSPTVLASKSDLESWMPPITANGGYAFWWAEGTAMGVVLWGAPTTAGAMGQYGSAIKNDTHFGPAFDGATVYWGENITVGAYATIRATPLGSAPVTLLALPDHAGSHVTGFIRDIKVDATDIYWLTDQYLVKMSK